MIAALAENELHEEALDVFTYMMRSGINPDTITYVCILNACACITAVEVAFILHAAVTEMKINEDTLVGTGIMDAYGKGGAVEDASKVFSSLSDHDVGSWNAMLCVFAHNGNDSEIKSFLKRFETNMFKPSCTTFISILVAFSHGGMVDDGWYFLYYMRNRHGLIPGIEHYICMVDLLGRAGQLNAAGILIDYMPFQRISIACRSMFSACIMHGNLEYGEHIARFCFELNGHSDSAYVMLSNMYATLGREDDEPSSISIIAETKDWAICEGSE
jgi:pentatricopeptide repeat protein